MTDSQIAFSQLSHELETQPVSQELPQSLAQSRMMSEEEELIEEIRLKVIEELEGSPDPSEASINEILRYEATVNHLIARKLANKTEVTWNAFRSQVFAMYIDGQWSSVATPVIDTTTGEVTSRLFSTIQEWFDDITKSQGINPAAKSALWTATTKLVPMISNGTVPNTTITEVACLPESHFEILAAATNQLLRDYAKGDHDALTKLSAAVKTAGTTGKRALRKTFSEAGYVSTEKVKAYSGYINGQKVFFVMPESPAEIKRVEMTLGSSCEITQVTEEQLRELLD